MRAAIASNQRRGICFLPVSRGSRFVTCRHGKIMTTKMAAILLSGALMFVLSQPCLAQQRGNSSQCSAVYENHNQVDYGPLKVGIIEGTSVIQAGPPVKGSPTDPGVPGACFTLFTEKDHALVASVKADSETRFEIRDISPGRYRLVARAEGLCTANIPLEVVKSSRRRDEMVVYFRPAGIDVCSTGELAPAPPRGSRPLKVRASTEH
jgi:hypothetical protein